MNGHEGIVKLLLEKKADVNQQDKDGETSLSYGK
jgi:ankyrin repeat protein